jgi:hypothetical protein
MTSRIGEGVAECAKIRQANDIEVYHAQKRKDNI